MELGLDGNTAVLTASSSGLGKASATALAREGVNVVLNGRDETRLAAAVDDIDDEGDGEVVGCPGDIADPETVDALVDRAVEEFGGLDHLVTSAGGPEPLRPLEADDEDWYAAFDMLVMSVVRLVRKATPSLRKDGGGTIVMITSRSVKEPRPGNVLSSSVRLALVGYQKTLARDLAPDIRTNSVLPGIHDTPRLDDFGNDIEEVLRALDEDIPVGHIGDPLSFGTTVAYLSSPHTAFINGQTILLDGGSVRTLF